MPETPQTIRLDQFLKYCGLAETGGQAKVWIQAGEVQVNGQVETRRRRQLQIGDVVDVGEQRLIVEDDSTEESESPPVA